MPQQIELTFLREGKRLLVTVDSDDPTKAIVDITIYREKNNWCEERRAGQIRTRTSDLKKAEEYVCDFFENRGYNMRKRDTHLYCQL